MTPNWDLLSVEEAAERLRVSVATVRRMCASGELPAERVGRRWVVQGASLPRRSRGRRRSEGGQAAGFDLQRAVAHIAGVDERERWVPDVLRDEDLVHAQADQIATAASRLDAREPYDPAAFVEIPKSPFFSRTGVLLTFPDRIAYQAVVAALAPAIEARLREGVYAASPATDATTP